MSLTASMWTSVSGLLAHGEKMNVVGNNISNVNTVGFKGQRMDFEDFVYQYVGTASGVGQVGRGTSIGIVMNDFGQGSFETSTENTDIGIQGNGFFAVKPKNSSTDFYTRAGNFRFDADGFLVDPHGYVLQGWKIDNVQTSHMSSTGATSTQGTSIKGTGVPVDVVLETFSCPPKHTNNMKMSINLDSSAGNDKTTHDDYPFFALLNTWDATPNSLGQITPLGKDSYAYGTTIEVFDEGGQAHKLTIYFDRVEQTIDTNIDGMKTNEITWEYIVTMDPTEDVRNFTNPPSPGGEVPEQYKGLLMSGTLTFNSSGQMKDMTAYVPNSQNMGDMDTWVEAPLSNNGYPVICPNFSGRDGASTAWDSTMSRINKEADGYLIEMNLGMRSMTPTWSGNAPSTIGAWTTTAGAGGPYKELHVSSGTANGTIMPNVGLGNAETGVVKDGTVYVQAIAGSPFVPGSGQVPMNGGVLGTTGDPLYVQKSSSDGVLTGEAVDGGWVYKQMENGSGEPWLQGDDSGTMQYFTLRADGMYYYNDAGPGMTLTALQTAYPGITTGLQPRPDLNQPVATQYGVPSTVAVLKYDAGGNPIPLTTTYSYNGLGTKGEMQENASTSYSNNTGKNFFERSRSQDGYTYGELRYVTVSDDGVLSGAYSNGVTLELYQIVLYDFASKQNLRREGGNLFSETRESGQAYSGAAGTGSFGTTKGNSLEQSNVDLAREFVNMITTQRGFQANSKSITTVDTMLEQVIQMKR